MPSPAPFFDRLLLWIDSAHPGAWNMAVDQAWLEQSNIPVLRAYGWDQPSVTIGYAQTLAKLQDALPGWPVIRRWTGGGVVLHQDDFTYSLIVPAAADWARTPAVESYSLIHRSLAEALVHHGNAGCRLALPEDVVEAPFCFVAPALHDVIRGPAKVAGAGQRRGKLGLLHQGSVRQVTLLETFWHGWALRLAREVEVVETLPAAIATRAAELARLRYDLPEWLESRDDQLQSVPANTCSSLFTEH